jgi:hypothetical protein
LGHRIPTLLKNGILYKGPTLVVYLGCLSFHSSTFLHTILHMCLANYEIKTRCCQLLLLSSSRFHWSLFIQVSINTHFIWKLPTSMLMCFEPCLATNLLEMLHPMPSQSPLNCLTMQGHSFLIASILNNLRWNVGVLFLHMFWILWLVLNNVSCIFLWMQLLFYLSEGS